MLSAASFPFKDSLRIQSEAKLNRIQVLKHPGLYLALTFNTGLFNGFDRRDSSPSLECNVFISVIRWDPKKLERQPMVIRIRCSRPRCILAPNDLTYQRGLPPSRFR